MTGCRVQVIWPPLTFSMTELDEPKLEHKRRTNVSFTLQSFRAISFELFTQHLSKDDSWFGSTFCNSPEKCVWGYMSNHSIISSKLCNEVGELWRFIIQLGWTQASRRNQFCPNETKIGHQMTELSTFLYHSVTFAPTGLKLVPEVRKSWEMIEYLTSHGKKGLKFFRK
jgi:hypothetical protein